MKKMSHLKLVVSNSDNLSLTGPSDKIMKDDREYINYLVKRSDFDLSVAYKALININSITSLKSELSLRLEKRVSDSIQKYGLNDRKCFDFIQSQIFLNSIILS